MNALELEFRKDLIRQLSGLWHPTIHMENNLNPGVPDLSYVMLMGDCETGWLELKAEKEPHDGNKIRFGVERSQYSWMRKHSTRVPAHFLMSVGVMIYMLPGQFANVLSESVTHQDLASCCKSMRWGEIRNVLPLWLITATDRGRNGGI